MAIFSNPEFWKAMASLAWPIVFLVVFLRLQPAVRALLNREDLTIKVAGMEVSVKRATENLGTQVADLQQKVATISSSATETSSEQAVKHRSTKSKLLWVDDYPTNNAFLIDKLRKDGIDVDISIATDEAMDRMRSVSYAAVITDLGRKEQGTERPMAGLDLIEKIRSEKFDVPILVFAGERGIRYSAKLLKAGASKVTDSGVDVLAFVETYLGRS